MRGEMAKTSISVDQDQFTCSVCLDLLKDPVTIPCGHSYCMSCISDCWDEEDQKGIYRCPLCKHTLTSRPLLGKNGMINEMVEKLKKTRLQSAPPVLHTASGDVQCDSCSENKQKAVKSCLECRSSYCQNHLEQHESLFRGKGHNLMDATGRLQDMICSRHGKLLEIYCRTDQQCICMLCLVDEHKNHDTVSTAAERKEKQSHFEVTQRNIQNRIQQREKDLQELREAVASHKRSAQTAVEDSERIFTELICSIERRRSEVTQLIRDQERAAVSRAEERLERLKQEIDDLRRRDAELKQLSHTHHHVHFLQSLSSVSLSGSTDGFTVSSRLSFDDVVKSVSQLRDKLQQFCSKETEKISGRVKSIQVILAPEYQIREEFLQYSHPELCTETEEPPFPPLFKTPSIKRASANCARTYPTPVSVSQPRVPKSTPTPVSIFQPSVPKPTPIPVGIFQTSVPKPTPTPVSISQPSVPKPTPIPVGIFQTSVPKPTPTPESISQPSVPKPTPIPVGIFQTSVPKPTPTPVSIFQPSVFKPTPTPVSIFQPSVFKPTPTPVSIFQPSVSKPTPTPESISQLSGPKPTPIPESIFQPSVFKPTQHL
ncbi:E3 ubiquitin-protein ligase TRIM47-like isoform X1 [Pseudorasbora parva]|uniref:E3 ubiquitin-protein ligase TRIM47-like isoform X1 n=1 Tax=Pseudorasbora parva TaxID=51549 RepID=UPI00351F0D4D